MNLTKTGQQFYIYVHKFNFFALYNVFHHIRTAFQKMRVFET